MNNAEYHIGLTKEQGAKYAILPGDPARTEQIAAYFDCAEELNFCREFRSFRGLIDNEPVLAVSTGIGAPSAAICIEELIHIGVDTFIRTGTCGGMQKDVFAGDLVTAIGSIRMDGTTKEYMPIEFPAVANLDVTNAIISAAKNLGYRNHYGIVQAKDSFYGQHDPNSMANSDELKSKWKAWIKGGCLASEMESSALFIVSAIRGAKAGAVFHCVWNQETAGKGMPEDRNTDTDAAVKTAVEAIRILIRNNRNGG